eukprot:sb/3474134/
MSGWHSNCWMKTHLFPMIMRRYKFSSSRLSPRLQSLSFKFHFRSVEVFWFLFTVQCVCVCVYMYLRTSIHTADVGDQLALISAGSPLGAHTPTTRAPTHTPRSKPPSVFKRVSPLSPPATMTLEMQTDRRSRFITVQCTNY